jgi:predicted N-acyltransferase
MRYKVSSVANIYEVDPHAWEEMALTASAYSSYPWLSYVETHNDAQVIYLLAYQEDCLVASLPVYHFREKLPLYYDPGFLFSASENRRSNGHTMIAGTREGYISEMLTLSSVPAADRRDIAASLLAELRRQARADGDNCAILYMPDTTAELFAPFRREGDRLAVIDAQAVMNVPAGGLATYIEQMPASKRQLIRRDIRRFERSGCQFREMKLSQCYRQLGGLSAELLNKYGHEANASDEASRFGRQAEWIDDISTVMCAYLEDRIVGFAHFIEWQDILYARAIGFDYSIAHEAGLYFNLLYYRAVQYASEHGISAIDYGCGSYETKVARGARLRSLWGLLLDAPDSGVDEAETTEQERRRLRSYAELDPAVITGTVMRLSPDSARWARESKGA